MRNAPVGKALAYRRDSAKLTDYRTGTGEITDARRLPNGDDTDEAAYASGRLNVLEAHAAFIARGLC